MILFVCVCYKTPDQATAFARSVVKSACGHPIEVVVVDNGNDPQAEQRFQVARCPNAVWLRSEQNLGYFAGASMGLRKYLDTHEPPHWVVVSNDDLVFDACALIRMLEQYGVRGDVGVVAPAVISSSTGHNLNPYMARRPSVLRMHFYKWAFAWPLCLRIYVKLSEQWRCWTSSANVEPKSPIAESVYALHGSILAFSAPYFRAGGTLDHGTFLYGEEITVAESCRRRSLKLVLDRSASVQHLDTNSTSRRIDKRVARWIAEGARYCADQYFPLSSLRSTDNAGSTTEA